MTAWRLNGTFCARELAVASPPSTSRSRTRRRDGSAIADHSSSSVPALIPPGGEQSLEAADEEGPAVTVVLGVARLLLLGPADPVETGLRDPQTCSIAALCRERELDQDGIPRHGRLSVGVAPSERELLRRLDRLHHQGCHRWLLGRRVLEHEGAGATRSQIELDPVREPLGDLVGLGDRAPHHVGRCLDEDFAFDAQVGHGAHPQLLTSSLRGNGVALPPSSPCLRLSR